MQLNDGLSSAMEGIEGQEKWGQSSQWRAQALQVEIRNVDRMLCDGYTLQCRQLSLFHDTCMCVCCSLPFIRVPFWRYHLILDATHAPLTPVLQEDIGGASITSHALHHDAVGGRQCVLC